MQNNSQLHLLFTLILMFSGGLLWAQQVYVVDYKRNMPIENVAVFNLDKSTFTTTDRNGVFQLSQFSASDTLILQHASYEEMVLTYYNVIQSNDLIRMRERYINLTEFVVSATKFVQNKSETPNKIALIKQEDIAFSNPQTAADIMQNSREVFVQKSQQGGGSPMIRGFSANAVLLVFNGVRMNNAIYRSGNLQNVIQIDPFILEDAEVIFGPGSVIYGSDALGGVMNFQSKAVQLSETDKSLVNGNAAFRYSTANNEQTMHFDVNYGRKKWGFLTSVSMSGFGDLRMGSVGPEEYLRPEYVERLDGKDSVIVNTNNKVQRFSGYKQANALQKISFKPNKRLRFDYSFYYTNSTDIPRYDRLIQYSDDQLKYAEWYYGPQQWMLNDVNVIYSDSNKVFDDMKITLAHQRLEESRNDRRFGKESLRQRTEKVNVLSLNADFDKSLHPDYVLYYGLEALHNDVNSSAVERNIVSGEEYATSTRYPDGGNVYDSYAAYLSLKTNAIEKYTFSAGVRFNYVGLKSTFEDTTFFNFPFREIDLQNAAVNGSIGMVYRPDPKSQFNINLASGFRAPNLDDVAKVFDSEPGSVVVPNMNLQPEYVYNADVSFVKDFSTVFKLDVGVFYTLLKDAMIRKDYQFNGQDSILYDGEMSKVQAVQNAGNARIMGGSLAMEFYISQTIHLYTNVNITHGRDQDDLPIRHAGPVFGYTSLAYKKPRWQAELYAHYNREISNKYLPPTEQSKTHIYAVDGDGNPYSPAWWTLNIKGAVKLSEHIGLNAGLENILDKRYRTYSSGISAPGRNFYITLRATI